MPLTAFSVQLFRGLQIAKVRTENWFSLLQYKKEAWNPLRSNQARFFYFLFIKVCFCFKLTHICENDDKYDLKCLEIQHLFFDFILKKKENNFLNKRTQKKKN